MNKLRLQLKRCEPYYVEKELMPQLYYDEERQETQYWIFFYSFVRHLSDEAIGVRLGYTRANILLITKKILRNNTTLITRFVQQHSR